MNNEINSIKIEQNRNINGTWLNYCNIDNITKTGMYYIGDSVTGKPSTYGYNYAQLDVTNIGWHVIQRILPYPADKFNQNIFVRFKIYENGQWTSWQQISNKPIHIFNVDILEHISSYNFSNKDMSYQTLLIRGQNCINSPINSHNINNSNDFYYDVHFIDYRYISIIARDVRTGLIYTRNMNNGIWNKYWDQINGSIFDYLPPDTSILDFVNDRGCNFFKINNIPNPIDYPPYGQYQECFFEVLKDLSMDRIIVRAITYGNPININRYERHIWNKQWLMDWFKI